MRHLFIIGCLLALVGWNLSCTKETLDDKPIGQPEVLTTFRTGDMDGITIARDGTYYPFMSPYSIVRYDIYSRTLYIYNIALIDSVRYVRQSPARSVYLGVIFNPYEATIYYSDGSSMSMKALAPEYLGSVALVIPDDDYNQLDGSHPDQWISIQRTNRRTSDYHAGCGVMRWKWWYMIVSPSGTTYNQQIEGRCDLSLDYELIF
jgi:hypothetical protein